MNSGQVVVRMEGSELQSSSGDKRFVLLAAAFLVVFVAAFAFFAEQVSAHKLVHFDSVCIQWVQSWIDPQLTRIMEWFTFVGSPKSVVVLTILCALLLFWQRRRWEALCLLVAVAGGGVFNEILKYVFHRQRPDLHRIIAETGYSFPSGHSMGSIVFFGTLAYFVCLFSNSAFTKVVSCILAVLLVLCIGVSRIYLGVHYPSDVIGGYAAGGAWLTVCIFGLRYVVRRRYNKRASTARS